MCPTRRPASRNVLDIGIAGRKPRIWRTTIAQVVVSAIAIIAAPCAYAGEPCLQTVALISDRPVDVAVAASTLLLEEVGVDAEYRWVPAEPFDAIATPPDRLGFAVLTARSGTLSLRVREGQGGGHVRLDTCLDAADASFYAGLAALQRSGLEQGREKARAALTALNYLLRWPLATRYAGWVGSTRANALASAGDNVAAEAASLESAQQWNQAGRPDRAAIALFAAGESASRGGRYVDAHRLLSEAAAALQSQGIGYYALRSESALCNLLSRQHRFREAIDCEQRVIVRWNAQLERREAALREISVANLWLSLREPDRAEPHFLRAEADARLLSPIVHSRLESSRGTYHLLRGDLPSAAQSLARAAQQLGSLGLPSEQNNLDLKLANLAQLAGAAPERVRLLHTATARLSGEQDPQRAANARLRLSQALLDTGDAAGALAAAETAESLCRKLGDTNCQERARLETARALLTQSQSSAARAVLAGLNSTDVDVQFRMQLLTARCDLLDGETDRAWQTLQAIDVSQLAPDEQIEHVQASAETLRQRGQSLSAGQLIAQRLKNEATDAARWPSAALRLSARNRLVALQASYFDAVLAAPDRQAEIDATTLDGVMAALDHADAQHLFARRANTRLTEPLRKALAGMIDGTAPEHQRALFVALAEAAPTDPAARDTLPFAAATDGPALDAGDVVLLPLAGRDHFYLLVQQGGVTRNCLRLSADDYAALVRRFDAALDGNDVELAVLQQEAEHWHALVRGCSLPATATVRWHVVATAGTASLPWPWIAAAGHDAEPTLTTTFTVPVARSRPLARPTQLVLFDLDMPTVAPLPLASSELQALQSFAMAAGIATRPLRAAEMPAESLLDELAAAPAAHIVGHANPAAFGQLYQGLWYEAAGKPMLLTYPEIASLSSRSELVVLSACGTRSSDQQRYGAAARLAEAWIAAGVRHVVAASNPLSDAAAPIWTRRFYATLWRDGDAAMAARDARVLLRQSVHFRNPKFWAGIDYYAAVPAESHRDADIASSPKPEGEEKP